MISAMDEHPPSTIGRKGDSPLIGPGRWTRFWRSGIELLLVRADWLTSANAAIRRGRRRELASAVTASQFWPLLLSALVDFAWLAAWSLIAVRFQSWVAFFFASFPVLKWLLLVVARQPAVSSRVEEPLARTITEPTSPARPLAPLTEQQGFEAENPRQFWMSDREIVSHHITGAVQE